MGIKLTHEHFIKRAKEIHKDKYDYSLIEYNGSKIKVKIICPVHGIFEQEPRIHLSGNGCKMCANDNLFSNNNKFIEKSNKIHNNKYDYSLVDYVNNETMVKILCPIHGIFEQKPKHHIYGCGCTEFFGGEKTFEERQKTDFIKNIYCKENNIILIRIKYNENIIEKLNENLKIQSI